MKNGPGEVVVEVDGATVIKSPNRRRTIAWRWLDGKLTLRVPARYTRKEIAAAIELAKQRATVKPRSPKVEDSALRREAEDLNRRYFGGSLTVASIRYAEMNSRRGSCTPGDATIRISTRLATVPAWVRLAVIHHELCHLLEPGHGPAFKALEARYPLRPHATDYLKLLEIGPDNSSLVSITAPERAALVALLDRERTMPELTHRLRQAHFDERLADDD